VIFLDEPFDDQTEWLHDALARENSSYLLLTTALPEKEYLESVLDGAYYQLTRRGGFIQSETYAAEPQKKDTQYFLAAGSVLKRKFSGGLFNVGESGKHPVYRYSAPVLLGVSL
jgi:CRISPR-associated protein Csm4